MSLVSSPTHVSHAAILQNERHNGNLVVVQSCLKRSLETNPFIKKYFLPRCAFVGLLFGIRFNQAGYEMMDVPDYGNGEWTDEEFAYQFNERNSADVLQEPAEMRWAEGIEALL